MSQELDLSDLQFGATRSATNVALILGAILFGFLADRWRRRDVVALGVLCWSAITWGRNRAALTAGVDARVSTGDPPERLWAAVDGCRRESCE